MAKSFKGGLDSLIGGGTSTKKSPEPAVGKALKKVLQAEGKRGPGRPRTSTKVPKDTTEEGTLPGEKRATFIVKEEHLEKLKAVAYWDRVKIKDALGAALDKYLEAYEKKNGPLKKMKR